MAKLDFTGQVAVVTGASSGIGLEFSRQLAALGADLVMVSNQPQELEQHAQSIRADSGVRVETMCLDLTAADCAERLLAFVDAKGMEIDVLINNAGIFQFYPLVDAADGKVNAFIDLHVRAVTSLCRKVGARMRERGCGHILNMSSMSCWAPMPGLAMYAATKAYIRVLSRSLHYELRDAGVRVTVATPGGISTSLFGLPENLKRLAVSIGALDTPQKFVRKALKKMAKGKMQYINGFINRAAIVMVGCAPTGVRMMVKRMMLDKNICRP